MSQTINRMFESVERAAQAVQALKTNRFSQFDHVYLFGRDSEGGVEQSVDQIVAAMMKSYVLKAHARVYAEKVKQGSALVTVHAPFGTGGDALEVLESFGPVDSGVPGPRDALPAWDEVAPCSSLFHIRVLLPDSATFSKFWNVPPLAKTARTTSAALGLPEGGGSSGPFAGTFGLPMLAGPRMSLSAMLGLPLLTGARAARA